MARILSVEDDRDLQSFLGKVLFGAGHEVHYAFSGTEGWEKVLGVDPALVFLDLMLPGLDGVEVLRRMRLHRPSAPIPVVVVTAYGDDAGLLTHALEALGAEAVLRKPARPAELLRAAEEALAARPQPPERREPPSARLARKGAVALDPRLGTVWVEDRLAAVLNAKELAALALLAGSAGPVGRAALMRGLGYAPGQEAALKQVVHRLRESLGEAHRWRVRTEGDGYELLG